MLNFKLVLWMLVEFNKDLFVCKEMKISYIEKIKKYFVKFYILKVISTYTLNIKMIIHSIKLE